MTVFQYLIDKIIEAPFQKYPFQHLHIKDFLTQDHFNNICQNSQINILPASSTEELIELLYRQYYTPVEFPGCFDKIDQYLEWFYGNKTKKFEGDLLEGFGMTFRIKKYKNEFIAELINFLNSNQFHSAIKEKFQIQGTTRLESVIQKYLSGYEISPHPDNRKKCITYMININSPLAENLDIHTHLMKFNNKYQHIYQYWKDHTEEDRCWVPWSWCDTVWKHNQNNSILMFSPDNDTIHAVKIDYDHLKLQRTNIYGNFWYCNESLPSIVKKRINDDWKRLPKK
jgi:hypothetical protein